MQQPTFMKQQCDRVSLLLLGIHCGKRQQSQDFGEIPWDSSSAAKKTWTPGTQNSEVGWTIHDGSGDLRSFRLFPDVSTHKISDGPYEQASFFDVWIALKIFEDQMEDSKSYE